MGTILIIAGGVKLAPLRELALFHWLVLPAVAVLAIGVAEFALGCLVISFSPRPVIHRATMAMFGLYVVVLILQLANGQSVCNCLGAQSLPVAWMLIADLALLAALMFFRREWTARLPDQPRNAAGDLLSAVRYALPTLVLVGVLAFGSFDAAISFVTGSRLVATTSTLHAGDLKDGQTASVAFNLMNYSSRPIHVAGAKASCKCLAWDDLPLTIPPGASRQVTIRVRGQGPDPRIQRETAYLAFDEHASAQTALSVTVRVRPSP
jgi:hypothetical protein